MENTTNTTAPVQEKLEKYEFVLVDGTYIAVEAHSQYEAARIIREMLVR